MGVNSQKVIFSFFFLARAALTDSAYAGGMCLGRLVSILLSRYYQPATLLSVATAACLFAAVTLLLLAPGLAAGFYTALAAIGFFVSWQFATGFSWTARHASLTGRLSSLLFIGKYCTFKKSSLICSLLSLFSSFNWCQFNF